MVVLYVAYSGTRLFADDTLGPAVDRAKALLGVERFLGVTWEHPDTDLFVRLDWLGLFGSYWYATAHYVVTAVVLVWLYRRGPTAYLPARRVLLVATVAGLLLYLLLPMAPPRLTGGYVDVLSLHSADGWWGSDASAPKGLGGFTNQLAAFPSLHCGWALWVALAVRSVTRNRAVRMLGWSYAAITAVVVVGTGNHWVLDAVLGWILVALAWAWVGVRDSQESLDTSQEPACSSGPSSPPSPSSASASASQWRRTPEPHRTTGPVRPTSEPAPPPPGRR